MSLTIDKLDTKTKDKNSVVWRAYHRVFEKLYHRKSDGYEFAPQAWQAVVATLEVVREECTKDT